MLNLLLYLFQYESFAFQYINNTFEKLLLYSVFYHKIVESADCLAIRNLIAGLHIAGQREYPAVDILVPGSCVLQVVKILKNIYTEHQREFVRSVSALSIIAAQSYKFFEFLPRHNC